MLQWITVLCLVLGILMAKLVSLPLVYLCVAFVPGLIMLAYQYRCRGRMWVPLVWNVTLVGAIWFTLRQQMAEQATGDDSPSFVQSLSSQASDHARRSLLESGVSESGVAVLNAMLLGNRGSLTYEQKARYRNAGAQHLLALSGLHLGIFISVLSFILLRRVRYTRWRWPVLLATLSLLWCYCLVAGMPQSLLRAMLMTTLFYLSLSYASESQGSINLANTLLLMLLIDPASLFDIGTQLSFTAVAALIWLYPLFSGIFPAEVFPHNRMGVFLRRFMGLFMVSLAAWLGTMPLCLYYFHQFQPWQPFVGVVLVPLTTLLLYTALLLLVLCILGFCFLTFFLAKGVTLLMLVQNTILDGASALPFSTVSCPGIHLGHIALLYALLFVLWLSLRATAKVQRYCLLEMLLIIFLLCVV